VKPTGGAIGVLARILKAWLGAAAVTAISFAAIVMTKEGGGEPRAGIGVMILSQAWAAFVTAHALSGLPHAAWHGGKIILLWGLVAALWFGAFAIAPDYVPGVALFGGGAVTAVTVLLTWTWLSGREGPPF